MKSLRNLFLLVAVSAASLSAVPRAHAGDVIVSNGDTYAAIAYSPKTGNYGYAYACGSRWQAERLALKKCEADDAKIVCWVNNGFCALALGDDKSCWGVGWEYGDGATNIDAKRSALEECSKRTTNARIVLCVCSEDVAPYVRK